MAFSGMFYGARTQVQYINAERDDVVIRDYTTTRMA